MIILGIDPGLHRTGWGVIDYTKNNNSIKYIASGVMQTKPADPIPFRLSQLTSMINDIIELYKPVASGLEEVFINNNALSSMKLCHARGAILAMMSTHGLNITEFAPTKVKKTIVGTGRASKEQISHMVTLIMPSSGKMKTADESDALAIAYCCAMHL